jgi:hypothetical protein
MNETEFFKHRKPKRLVRNRIFSMGFKSRKIEWGLKIGRAREPLALCHTPFV